MPRTYKPSSSRDSSRSNSSRGSDKDYALSVNLYGRGDKNSGDPPAHWGTMIHKRGESQGDLFHVRKNEDFYYDRSANRPVESTTSYGRSEVRHLSNSRRLEAERVLGEYGSNHSNLPQGGENCQHWTVGALGALERERLAPRGTSDYWRENIDKSSLEIGERLRRDEKSWIPKNVGSGRERPADATFGREQPRRPVGRLNLDKFSDLSGKSSKYR